MLRGRVTTRCPASLLWLHPDVTVYCDRAAARGLRARAPPTRAAKAVGIDIGGTKIAFATVSGRARSCAKPRSPTESGAGLRVGNPPDRRGGDGDPGRDRLEGAGPGRHRHRVRRARRSRAGTIHNPYTLPGWMDADIVSPLRSLFGCPVVLENDADMALLGECWQGRRPRLRSGGHAHLRHRHRRRRADRGRAPAGSGRRASGAGAPARRSAWARLLLRHARLLRVAAPPAPRSAKPRAPPAWPIP